jgi:antitoxin (DNA-binding transcriptional repressor) of toxin-antitoxin stability system
MKVIELENESRPVTQLLGLARTEPLVFTRKGRPVAALVDVADDDLETLSLRTNAEFQAYLQQCRERHDRQGGISLEEMRARYGLSPRATARRGRRAKPAKKGR